MSLNQQVIAEFSPCTPSAPQLRDLSIQTLRPSDEKGGIGTNTLRSQWLDSIGSSSTNFNVRSQATSLWPEGSYPR
jgi:hypothetical protein